jgi:NADPH:quinone reductase-like Zn-dependent oxidoreductase
MGIVPENEYMIGCECSGVVKRLGEGVTKFKVGDRVAVMRSGTYANRLQTPIERTHVIPDWMSFEDAATIPLVYMTALYSLFHLGNLQEGMVSSSLAYPPQVNMVSDPFGHRLSSSTRPRVVLG